MKLVPNVISTEVPSKAERRLFELLSETDLGNHAVALHSVNLSRHNYKVSGEIDFIVLSPKGLLVLEVKGGGVICDENGIWSYIDRFGQIHRSSEGPFKQAQSAMFSLRKQLAETLDISSVRFGYAVVFPDINFDVRSVSWDAECVIDGPQLTTGSEGLKSALNRVYNYWERKLNKTENAHVGTVQRVIDILRPCFEKVPSVAYQADDLERLMEGLTIDQYRLIDAAADNKRILCKGGAGTGKTFLLAELCRRHIAKGQSVLVTCSSDLFCAYLKSRLPKHAEIVAFSQLKTLNRTYDVLLVDEGQDILSYESLSVLDRVIKNGLDGGWWRIFLDDNLQASIFDVLDPDAIEYLTEYGTTLRLTNNCRNTKDIANQTKLSTGADIGFPVVGDGPPVHFKYFKQSIEQVGLLEKVLDELINDDVPRGQITILSPLPYQKSVASRVSNRFKLKPINDKILEDFPPRETSFASIHDFKGLENRFVIVTDLEKPIETAKETALLYVGMTRARVGLFILMSESTRTALSKVMLENLPKLTGSL